MIGRFAQHRLALAGLVLIAVLTLMSLLADVLGPDPYGINPDFRAPPSANHLLGTDQVGRDVFSRLLHASRVSLSVGVSSALIAVTIGTVLGLLAGFYRGAVDAVLMRFTDMVLAFPALILVLVVVSLVGPSVQNVIAVLGVLSWPVVARLVRANVLSLREQDFVLAARCLGVGDRRLLFRHLLPNTLTPVLVAATIGAAFAILTEASLSFLGLGVQPPQPSWGNMLLDAQSLTILRTLPWLWAPPGLMILIAVLSMNFIGDGIRDAMDPRTLTARRDVTQPTARNATRPRFKLARQRARTPAPDAATVDAAPEYAPGAAPRRRGASER
jgi:peptide/nickel transport system permease protein